MKKLKLNRDKFKGFTMGVVATLVCTSLVGTVFAAGQLKSIKVIEGGIKLYVDGKLAKPTDVKGNVVEPFIYDGTTYLPLRALSNILTNNEKEVAWDGKTSTVYIGQVPVAEHTEIDKLSQYNTSSIVYIGERASFRILDQTITPFNRMVDDSRFDYMLHSKYSTLYAKFVVPYTSLGSTDKGHVQFFNVDRYGVESLITEYSTVAGDEALDVEVDLRGVEILRIRTYGSMGRNGQLYNVTLEGMN